MSACRDGDLLFAVLGCGEISGNHKATSRLLEPDNHLQTADKSEMSSLLLTTVRPSICPRGSSLTFHTKKFKAEKNPKFFGALMSGFRSQRNNSLTIPLHLVLLRATPRHPFNSRDENHGNDWCS